MPVSTRSLFGRMSKGAQDRPWPSMRAVFTQITSAGRASNIRILMRRLLNQRTVSASWQPAADIDKLSKGLRNYPCTHLYFYDAIFRSWMPIYQYGSRIFSRPLRRVGMTISTGPMTSRPTTPSIRVACGGESPTERIEKTAYFEVYPSR